MIRPYRLTGVIMLCVGFLVVGCQRVEVVRPKPPEAPVVSAVEAPEVPKETLAYVPGDLLVKFKRHADIERLQAYLRKPAAAKPHLLVDLCRQHGLIQMARVFREGPSPKELKARFPQRIPKGISSPDLSRTYRLSFPQATNIPKLAMEFTNLSKFIEYNEPNFLRQVQDLPNDTYVDPDQNGTWSTGSWVREAGHQEDLWGLARIGMEQAWGITQGSSDVIVAVIDTGLDYTHLDIVGKVWQNLDEDADRDGRTLEWDGTKWVLDPDDLNDRDDDQNGYLDDLIGFDLVSSDFDPVDDHGHGTHVAGTIAATTNNAKGVAGISWDSPVMVVKTQDEFGGGFDDVIARGIQYAADNGAKIINMSLGGAGSSQTMKDAVTYAYAGFGAVVVASAGNDNQDIFYWFPAGLPHLICVGAWGYDDTRAIFLVDLNDPTKGSSGASNYGEALDVTAPGVDILSLKAERCAFTVGTDYCRRQGTSMAAPHVSGVVALMRALSTEASPDLVQAILQGTAEDVSQSGLEDDGIDLYTGYGLLNAAEALDEVQTSKAELLVLEPSLASALILSATQVQAHIEIANVGTDEAEAFQYRLYAGSGEGGTLLEEATLSLGINDAISIDRTFSMEPLAAQLTLQLDPEDSIKEYNERNNSLTLTLTTPLLAGWPVAIDTPLSSAPAIGDLDPLAPGLEIVVIDASGIVYAWHADGTSLAG